jgi:CHAD domain-containing protein
MKKGFSKEVIHLFRVDTKKLRALLRMIRTATEEPHQLKFPRRFKKMYSMTGKIRDRQLCLKRIRENKKVDDSRLRNKVHSMEKEIQELAGKRNDFLTKKEFEEIEENMIKRLPIVWKDAVIRNFFQQKLHVINEVAGKGEYKDKELHNIRKSIKDIIYIMRIYRDDLKMPFPFPFWNEAELKKAEGFSHKLGLFNDTCIALSFLAPSQIRKTETAEREHLQLLRRQWLAGKRKLKKEILDIYNSNYKDALFGHFPGGTIRKTATREGIKNVIAGER